jgi:hypothetical protein
MFKIYSFSSKIYNSHPCFLNNFLLIDLALFVSIAVAFICALSLLVHQTQNL